MSDKPKNENAPNLQANQAWYPGPGMAPLYAYPGWGYGHHHHHPAEAPQPADAAPQPAIQGGPAWSGPAMVWWTAQPPQAVISPAPAWPAQAPAQAQPAAPAQAGEGSSLFSSGLGVHNDALIKGLLIGAGAAYLLTNETVQKNLMTAAVKLWSTFQGGVEEVKERFRDAEAEVHAGETK